MLQPTTIQTVPASVTSMLRPSTISLNQNGTWTLSTLPATRSAIAAVTRILMAEPDLGQMLVTSLRMIDQSESDGAGVAGGDEAAPVAGKGVDDDVASTGCGSAEDGDGGEEGEGECDRYARSWSAQSGGLDTGPVDSGGEQLDHARGRTAVGDRAAYDDDDEHEPAGRLHAKEFAPDRADCLPTGDPLV
jgi:hypothetical protein